jgi:hypothetical protein
VADQTSESPLTRAALVVSRFRDMAADATVAAVATTEGADRLTYGDLRSIVTVAFHHGDQLQRISTWHSRETGPHGTVGDCCNECGHTWPCDTRRMADGTYKDDDDA